MSPSVAVITPILNASPHLPSFARMLFAQTFTNWHLYLIDDGSTDNSVSLAHSLFQHSSRYTLLTRTKHLSVKGPHAARNTALAIASEPYIAFCDVDDLWHPQKLEIQLSLHISAGSDISYTCYTKFSADPSIDQQLKLIQPFPFVNRFTLFFLNPIPLSSCICTSSLLPYLSFPPVHHEDYALWIHLLCIRPSTIVSLVSNNLLFYRKHSSNLTKNRLAMPYWAFCAFRFTYSFPLSVFGLICWCLTRPFTAMFSYTIRSSPFALMAEHPVSTAPFSRFLM